MYVTRACACVAVPNLDQFRVPIDREDPALFDALALSRASTRDRAVTRARPAGEDDLNTCLASPPHDLEAAAVLLSARDVRQRVSRLGGRQDRQDC
ncbi:hypothetical protein A0H81_05184 [Grifola frondosa]|uniref:Uncharacterized protein n=1 Tax=Grifola frondosa TaxID=5627 RepID=A0A1C7MDC0_GRIFR|nr:hypothetical protein A0H81_05184 [Grifola frondosa]